LLWDLRLLWGLRLDCAWGLMSAEVCGLVSVGASKTHPWATPQMHGVTRSCMYHLRRPISESNRLRFPKTKRHFPSQIHSTIHLQPYLPKPTYIAIQVRRPTESPLWGCFVGTFRSLLNTTPFVLATRVSNQLRLDSHRRKFSARGEWVQQRVPMKHWETQK